MSKAKKNTKKIQKKTIRLQIASRLEETFADLQEALGKTKFQRNIKKASKALAADLKEVKTKAVKSKPAKKSSKLSVSEIKEA